MKVGLVGFTDGLNVECERKRGAYDDTKFFDINNWNNGGALYWNEP